MVAYHLKYLQASWGDDLKKLENAGRMLRVGLNVWGHHSWGAWYGEQIPSSPILHSQSPAWSAEVDKLNT